MLDICYTVVDFVCLFSRFFFFGICTPPGAFKNNSLCKILGKKSILLGNQKQSMNEPLLTILCFSISLCTSVPSCSKAD